MTSNAQEKPIQGSVIWAVDPFETEGRPLVSAVRELVQWASRSGLRLFPVYVVSSSEKLWESGKVPPLSAIEKELGRYLKRFSLGESARPRVVFDPSATRRGAVEVLLKLAKAERAEWIAVSSHGRASMERLVLGSFIERLLHESTLPVLILARRPGLDREKLRRRVLFATEFSPFADEALECFFKHARTLNFDLTILHLLAYPIASVDMGIGSAIPENFFAEQEKWARTKGALWVHKARELGVRARFVLKDGGAPALLGKSILEEAKKEGVRLIAMPALPGHFTRLVEGSIAFQIFRAGRYPVFLYGPAATGEAERSRTAAKPKDGAVDDDNKSVRLL